MKKVFTIILMALAITAFFVSCDEPKHEHSFDPNKWEKDGTSHWHVCTTCGEKVEVADHTLETTKAKEPTCTENGWDEYVTCSICAYSTYKEKAALGHTYDENDWKSDSTNHWRVCTACDEKVEVAAHTFEWKQSEDKYYQECKTCGYKTEKEHKHKYAETWSKDGNNHWHVCECGAKSDEATHTFEWKQSEDKTKHYQECKICGYKTAEAAHSIKYEKYSSTEHKVKCECGYEKTDAHDYEYITIEEATTKHQRKCKSCGFTTDEVTHTYNKYDSDGTNHWKVCECGAKETTTEAHNFGPNTVKEGKAVQSCTVCGYDKTITKATVEVKDASALAEAVKAEGVKIIKLTDAINITTAIDVTKSVVLDLDGKVITVTDDGSIKMSGEATEISISNIAQSQGALAISGAEASVPYKNGSESGIVYYSKLSDAIKEATAWDTITVLDNVSLTEAVSTRVYFTVDMNEKTLSYGEGGSITLADKAVSFKNTATNQSALKITGAVAKIGDASKLKGGYFMTLDVAHQMVGYKKNSVLFAEGNTISLLDDVTLASTWKVTKQITLDLNSHAIRDDNRKGADGSWAVISVSGEKGDLTIKGNGTIEAKTLSDTEKSDGYSYFAVSVENASAKVTIEDGTFIGNSHAIYVYAGSAVINGGYFKIKSSTYTGDKEYNYVLNCYNTNYSSDTAKISVTGGSFENFNPYWNGTDTIKPGDDGNFVAEEYESVKTSEQSGGPVIWKVQQKQTN